MSIPAPNSRVAPGTAGEGYTLVELVVVMVIIGIMATVALRSLRGANETARIEETRAELDRLAQAVAGNPDLLSGGARTDYGYVGDMGSLPPDLDALVTNPGGPAWSGPYLHDEFYAAAGAPSATFKTDAWGKPYLYSGGNTITAVGGPVPLTRQLAAANSDLLYNRLSLVVTDLAGIPPGNANRDSVKFILIHPRGGIPVTRTTYPAADGSAAFDSIPIGRHLLRLVYLPTSDTLTRRVGVDPGSSPYLELQWPEEVFE